MAYQAKRYQKVIEDLELINEKGSVDHVLHIELDANSIVRDLSRKHLGLIHAHQELEKLDLSDTETLGCAYEKIHTAMMELFLIVFGDKNMKVIHEFYGDRFVDMSREITPFVVGVVIPKVREQVKEQKKEIMQQYNRKQRRIMIRRS